MQPPRWMVLAAFPFLLIGYIVGFVVHALVAGFYGAKNDINRIDDY